MVNRYLEKRSHAAWRAFFFGGSVPMQRGARFLIFDVHLGGARWAESGRPKQYKTNDF